MLNDQTKRKKRCIWILLILVICVLAGCGKNKEEEATSAGQQGEETPEYTEFFDLNGKTVSMLTGAPFEELVKSKAPDVKEFTTYNNNPDMILALKSRKTDAALSNNAVGTLAVNRMCDLWI